MILPITAFGDPILRAIAKEISKEYPNLQELINHMFETMYEAQGVGLAAPQINHSIRLFIVDTTPFAEDDEDLEGFKKVFINAKIIEEEGVKWVFNEGCLSFPKLREDVYRLPRTRIAYYDENFVFHDEWFDGIKARVIQHEYDHIEGIVFIDHLSALKKTLIKRRLSDISKGFVKVDYKMKFINQKKNR